MIKTLLMLFCVAVPGLVWSGEPGPGSSPVGTPQSILGARSGMEAIGAVGAIKTPKGKEIKSGLYVRVPSKEVCMVNNAYMGREQIAVAVGGKTYYGCCEGCKKTLAEKAESRSAKDPLSGKDVDKATAVIGKHPGGNTVEYFETLANLKRYRP